MDWSKRFWSGLVLPGLDRNGHDRTDYSDNGYILEVDLAYPDELHGLHSDYPSAPESMSITNDMISDHSKKLMQKLNIGNSNVPI